MPAAFTSWFAHPQALALLALLPTLVFLLVWARRRGLQSLALFAGPMALGKLVQLRPEARRWRTLAFFAGLVLLILGIAGPQWGSEPLPPPISRGDLIVVVDASRSMFAEQPSRFERALRSLQDLGDGLARAGGRRVGLVVFAAQPKVWFPLTADIEHFQGVVRQLGQGELPPSLRPNADAGDVSGTRIGAALKLAVTALEPARPGQAILLLSDGDDPAGDEEWLEGVQAARARKLAIHVIGVGDPAAPHVIPHQGEFLQYQGEVVKTRFQENLLQEIARRTQGHYFPSPAGHVPLASLLLDPLTADAWASGHEEGKIPALTIPRRRPGWFLFPALGLFTMSLWLRERPHRLSRRWSGFGKALAAALAFCLMSAAPPTPVDLMRQGNEAFARGEFEDALKWYGQAEDRAPDPGLVAFNKAAAYFRLGRFREADLHYQRVLEDEGIPRERRIRAWFDLGNARVRQAGADNASLLESAIASFRNCLAEADPSGDLAHDARHNLELAALLWTKATAKNPDKPPEGTDPPPDPVHGKNPNIGPDPKGNGNNGNTDPDSVGKNGKGPLDQTGKPTGKPAQGPLTVLPDDNELVPLSPRETEAHLHQLAERILRDRRAAWSQRVPPLGKVKDW